MKINILQFKDSDDWSESFQLHFIINNLTTKKSTYHTGNEVNSYYKLLHYDNSDFTESFKFEGEVE